MSLFRWGRRRSRRTLEGEQPSRASISHQPVGDEMEEDQGAAIPPLPPRHSMSEWVSFHDQAVPAVAAPSSSSRAASRKAVKMIESARRLGAQEFQGTADPALAEAWLGRMERAFELMLCTEEQKLRIAAYMLEGRDLEWWTSIRNRQQPDIELRWEDFKREYNLQFYPSVYRDQKRREFLALT